MSTPVEHLPASGRADPAPGAPGMSGGVPEQTGPYTPATVSGRPAVPAELRGRTDISDRVVSRIATRAAGEVARVRKVGERGPLSLRGGTRATVDGELTTLRLDVTVDYPAPLREVAQQVRSHVAERIMTLTGLYVGHIDIDVVNVALTGTTRTAGTAGPLDATETTEAPAATGPGDGDGDGDGDGTTSPQEERG